MTKFGRGFRLIDGPGRYSGPCVYCKHQSGRLSADRRPVCPAFPEGIPDRILSGELNHRQPVLGDHGIRYEPHPVALRHGTAPPK